MILSQGENIPRKTKDLSKDQIGAVVNAFIIFVFSMSLIESCGLLAYQRDKDLMWKSLKAFMTSSNAAKEGPATMASSWKATKSKNRSP